MCRLISKVYFYNHQKIKNGNAWLIFRPFGIVQKPARVMIMNTTFQYKKIYRSLSRFLFPFFSCFFFFSFIYVFLQGKDEYLKSIDRQFSKKNNTEIIRGHVYDS